MIKYINRLTTNYQQIIHKVLWLKALNGMAMGFFSTLILSAVLQLFTWKIAPDQVQWNSPHLLIQIQNYLRFLTPAVIGLAIGISLQLNIYQIISCTIVASLSAHSTLVVKFIRESNTLSFQDAKIGLNFFQPNFGDVFASLLSTIFLVYGFKLFKFDFQTFNLVIYPLISLLFAFLALITIGPLSSLIFESLKFILANLNTSHYSLTIMFAPIIGLIVGLALPLPISSTALALALDLKGHVGLIAFTGTSAITFAFTVMTWASTKSVTKTLLIWFGTPMLLMPQYMKNPKMLIIPIFIGLLTPLLTSIIFCQELTGWNLNTNSIYVGLGFTTLFLPQIMLILDNSWPIALLYIILFQMLLPGFLSYFAARKFLRKKWLTTWNFDF